jgi:hypothetical protein
MEGKNKEMTSGILKRVERSEGEMIEDVIRTALDRKILAEVEENNLERIITKELARRRKICLQ